MTKLKETKFIDPDRDLHFEMSADQTITKMLSSLYYEVENTKYLEGKIEYQEGLIDNLIYFSTQLFKKIQSGEKFTDKEIEDMSGCNIVETDSSLDEINFFD